MAVARLKEFLDRNHVRYVSIVHSPAYTAQQTAETSLISGDQLAKTVVIRVAGKLAMAVLPASFMIDFDRLKKDLDTDDVVLAAESEFIDKFPGCNVGAMPPFGNLFDMEVYTAHRLSNNKKISFNAGTHSELLTLTYSDFERLVNPKVLKFCYYYE